MYMHMFNVMLLFLMEFLFCFLFLQSKELSNIITQEREETCSKGSYCEEKILHMWQLVPLYCGLFWIHVQL
jgi:hypothetical protein